MKANAGAGRANLAALAMDHLSARNYIRKADPEQGYWVDFSATPLQELRSRHGSAFGLIIHGNPQTAMDFYVIPFAAVAHMFTDDTMARGKDGRRRWIATIREHRFHVNHAGPNVDVSGYYGRPELLDGGAAVEPPAGPEPGHSPKAALLDARQRAVTRMANTALHTTENANGQQVLRTVKNKELRFAKQQELERYIGELVDRQRGRCAITGLELQFDDEHDDPALLCSLDRIDSGGHYEAGNLQVVCRFVNRWKNDGNDAEFRRLIDLVRRAGVLPGA